MGKVFSEMGVSLNGFIAGPNGGPGVRLFDQVGPALALEGIEVIESRLVTHLKYQVGK